MGRVKDGGYIAYKHTISELDLGMIRGELRWMRHNDPIPHDLYVCGQRRSGHGCLAHLPRVAEEDLFLGRHDTLR